MGRIGFVLVRPGEHQIGLEQIVILAEQSLFGIGQLRRVYDRIRSGELLQVGLDLGDRRGLVPVFDHVHIDLQQVLFVNLVARIQPETHIPRGTVPLVIIELDDQFAESLGRLDLVSRRLFVSFCRVFVRLGLRDRYQCLAAGPRVLKHLLVVVKRNTR